MSVPVTCGTHNEGFPLSNELLTTVLKNHLIVCHSKNYAIYFEPKDSSTNLQVVRIFLDLFLSRMQFNLVYTPITTRINKVNNISRVRVALEETTVSVDDESPLIPPVAPPTLPVVTMKVFP